MLALCYSEDILLLILKFSEETELAEGVCTTAVYADVREACFVIWD